jgi:hypothetical protein
MTTVGGSITSFQEGTGHRTVHRANDLPHPASVSSLTILMGKK